MKITLIGAGNVATHLGIALCKAGHSVLQVYSHTEAHADQLAEKLSAFSHDRKSRVQPTSNVGLISSRADLFLVMLTDSASEELIKKFNSKGKIIAHTSGSLSMDVFSEKLHENQGVFYPLQTLSKGRKINFHGVPLCIEANNRKTERALLNLASSISGNVRLVSSAQRKVLHLSAVFVNNFSNHLFSIAENILQKEDLPFELLEPLIKETAAKIKNKSPRVMQTGPAIRHDRQVLEKHIEYLSGNPLYRKIYELMTQSIMKESRD